MPDPDAVSQSVVKTPNFSGIVVVDKPAGMTSHDVVGVARKLFRTRRVGHTGTLDPDATGVLVLCLGNATRLAEYLSAARKHYVAEVVFGIETDTQDASGQVTAERDASHLTEEIVLDLLPAFRGAIEQVPPMVSALHHEGQRLYDLARQGITVERAARAVHIDELELTRFVSGARAAATLEITCSTGTYIRSLAADLGTAASTGGMMQSLRRTWVGERLDEADRPFTLERAQTLDELREHAFAGTLADVVLPLSAALSAWPRLHLSAEQSGEIRHGRALLLAHIAPDQRGNWHLLEAWEVQKMKADTANAEGRQDTANKVVQEEEAGKPPPVALLDESGGVLAIAQIRNGQVLPHKVFAS